MNRQIINLKNLLIYLQEQEYGQYNLCESIAKELVKPIFLYSGKITYKYPISSEFSGDVEYFYFKGYISPIDTMQIESYLSSRIDMEKTISFTEFTIVRIIKSVLVQPSLIFTLGHESEKLHEELNTDDICYSSDKIEFTVENILFDLKEIEKIFIKKTDLNFKNARKKYDKKEVFKAIVPTVLKYLGHDPENLPDPSGDDGAKKQVLNYLGSCIETKFLIEPENTFNGYWQEFFSKKRL